MSVLANLNPNKVFEFFEYISSVPHGSDNTDRISNLCCEFARERGLRYVQDELGNVIIYKPGTAGYESHEPVIIQGHIDMVTVKTPDCDIDLEADGLRLAHNDEFVWAEGTSLGADDGIAVAMAMAVLDSDLIAHPPIEAVFTINEETGMDGANFINTSKLNGKTMLNIDSEEEGIITCGCAGGIRVYGSFPLNPAKITSDCAEICISGLTGGHSGNEIHKGRANANILMGRLLYELYENASIRIVSIAGGEKDNAIANSCKAVFVYSTADFEKIEAVVKRFETNACEKYSDTDSALKISINNLGAKSINAASEAASSGIIKAMAQIPDGVQKMSGDIEGLVQTSLNFGIIDSADDCINMTFCLRSSVSAERDALADNLSAIIFANGGEASTGGKYPAWEYAKDSPVREKAVQAYEKLFGKKPEITVIHAGLECGLFADKIKNLDCISFGPNIPDIHTVSEKLDIKSTQRVWKFLLELLRNL